MKKGLLVTLALLLLFSFVSANELDNKKFENLFVAKEVSGNLVVYPKNTNIKIVEHSMYLKNLSGDKQWRMISNDQYNGTIVSNPEKPVFRGRSPKYSYRNYTIRGLKPDCEYELYLRIRLNGSTVTTPFRYTFKMKPDETVEYAITWKNYDGTVLLTNKCNYGSAPEYTGETPTKPSDDEFNYVFKGWEPEVGKIYSATEYVAVFEQQEKGCDEVGHKWDEGTIIKHPTAKSEGEMLYTCSVCKETKTEPIPKLELDSRIASYYVVQDGKVIDLVTEKTIDDAVITGDHWTGGVAKFPALIRKGTMEIVADYDRTSTDYLLMSLSYYGGGLNLRQVEQESLLGYIKTPFGGGQIDTNYILHPSIALDRNVYPEGDNFWALTVNKEDGVYAAQINNDYFEKTHWSHYFANSVTLSNVHKYKSIVEYNVVLTKEELLEHFEATGISPTNEGTIIGRVVDGIEGLGAVGFTKTGKAGIPEFYNTSKETGTYTVEDGNGMEFTYEIKEWEQPDNGIDHSKYESVHILKKPKTLYINYKYPLSAIPYPFDVNHSGTSDQFDVEWKSSNENVATIIDGLVIPHSVGKTIITATLMGTDMSDSFELEIINKPNIPDKVLNISANYVSKKGNFFSDTNYVMTSNAIFDAIDEAYAEGYNHVVFPKMNFYATPTGTTYYIPTGMTVEFPEGSEFHMMKSDITSNGYVYFRMGWDWYDYHIPAEKAEGDYYPDGSLIDYYCRNAKLIMDKYYGEFYKEGATEEELSAAAKEIGWNGILLNIGRHAEYCVAEIREANCPCGYFITMGGKAGSQAMVNAGKGGYMKAENFVSGWLNDNGEIEESENWVSTTDFFVANKGAQFGGDILHNYYLGEWEQNMGDHTARLYDILWYDKDYNFIQANRWQFTDETYEKPQNAVYFKVSVQSKTAPTELGIQPGKAARFCEVRNMNVIYGADGICSVTGATDGCWIHDNYTNCDGLISGWSLDLENGWQGMRNTVIERNITKRYMYSTIGPYVAVDTGNVCLASGFNTFIINNFMGSLVQTNYSVLCTHAINNIFYSMYSSISGGKCTDIRSKIWAHTYYNVIGDSAIKDITANGINYKSNNINLPVGKW